MMRALDHTGVKAVIDFSQQYFIATGFDFFHLSNGEIRSFGYTDSFRFHW